MISASPDSLTPGLTIFAHELVQLDVIRVMPPFPPFVGIGSGDTRISDGCIKPNIDDFALHGLVLLFVSDLGHFNTPLQISSDGARSQSLAQHPRLDYLPFIRNDWITIPVSLQSGFLHPVDQFGLDEIKSETSVCGGSH